MGFFVRDFFAKSLCERSVFTRGGLPSVPRGREAGGTTSVRRGASLGGGAFSLLILLAVAERFLLICILPLPCYAGQGGIMMCA